MTRESLERAAPLLLQMCELSVDVFEKILPVIEGEAKQNLQILRNTMIRTISMAKTGRNITLVKGEKNEHPSNH